MADIDDLMGGAGEEEVSQPMEYVEPEQPKHEEEEEEASGAADPYSSISTMDKEPASIRQWKEEQAKRLADMQKQSEAAEKELLEKAKKEMSEWKTSYQTSINEQRNRNKNEENEFIKLRDETTPGNEWERVGRLVDFTANKVAYRTRDVSRMRTILISLKQTGLVR
eukprot:m.211832 g.211832  ORF g.211832 m.211832 type:complete len:167 (+) comp18982_c0_seq1:100-600(+)